MTGWWRWIAAFALLPLILTWPARTMMESPAALSLGPATLHGTLSRPDGEHCAPGVLILAGSGSTDRDGNSVLPDGVMLRNDSLKLLAAGLTARGIAALRVDKRGVGMSRVPTLDESDLRFETYVSDARAWAMWMASQPGIARVSVLGHSEGALVAVRAAQELPDVASLVSVAGAGEPAGQTIRRQLAEAGVEKALRKEADRVLSAVEAGQRVANPPPALHALLRPSVQPYLASWLALDPAAEFAKLRVPTLVVQGTTDLQISLADAQLLTAAKPGTKLLVLPGMNHVLKEAPADRASNFATYSDPHRALAPGLGGGIADFVMAATPPGCR